MEPVCNFELFYFVKYIFDLVDFTEFMLAIALTQSGDLDERLALAFDMYDYNNTGTSKLD
jgi:Ca2+-binding EF-hand superfamily protein